MTMAVNGLFLWMNPDIAQDFQDFLNGKIRDGIK